MLTTLSNGLKIPMFGYGTYAMTTPEDHEALKNAIINQGYRHIDTASYYKNEDIIGDVLQDIFATTSIKREDLYITTKAFSGELHEIKNAIKASLQRLKLDYLDLYLIHWPFSFTGTFPDVKFRTVPVHVQWKEMEDCVKLGLTKSIGVSNFNVQLLNDLLTYAEIRPVCNQIELHPYNVQYDLVEWLKQENILPIAYSPLAQGHSATSHGRGTLINDPVINKIAQKHEKSPAQIIFAWELARGHCVIPKTSNLKRTLENFESQKIKLSEEEVAELSALNCNFRCINPKEWKYHPSFKHFALFD